MVVTIPLPVLRTIHADFPPRSAPPIAAVDYVPAVKVAFQAERRFWELDDAIYGGISWTARDITQVWYPSAGIHQRKGILVGAYIWSEDIGDKFAAMPPADRLAAALADGERLHPDYRRHLTNGVVRGLEEHPVQRRRLGGVEPRRSHEALPTLLKGDGPFLFAGEHMSHINGWQEGAVRSAHLRAAGYRRADARVDPTAPAGAAACPMACSKWWPTRSTVASPQAGPMISSPSGSPAAVNPPHTTIDGIAATLATVVSSGRENPSSGRCSVSSGAAPGGRRGDQHVEPLECLCRAAIRSVRRRCAAM